MRPKAGIVKAPDYSLANTWSVLAPNGNGYVRATLETNACTLSWIRLIQILGRGLKVHSIDMFLESGLV